MLVIVLLLVLFSLSLGTTFISGNDFGSFGIVLVSGLFNAMLLFLVASGMSIVFGLMDVLNLAQGAYFTVGAYVAWQVHHLPQLDAVDPNIRFVLAVLTATAVGGILGIVLERGLLQPLYSRPIFQIVLTFGVGIVLVEIIKAIWGTAALQWVEGFSLNETAFTIFEQQLSIYRLFVIGMGFLLIVALENFQVKVADDLVEGFSGQGLSQHQAVILASIVQREAVIEDEMPLIASVFINRLESGMKLDSDPTVQYAHGFIPEQNTWWKNPLSLTDLEINSPYNTYLYPGLLPGPISNPGLNALLAVAFPARTPYYYFRMACNGSGRHSFAENFAGHLANACP